MRPQKLDMHAVTIGLAQLPGWTLRRDGKAIVRTFRFDSFAEAFGFMTQSALAAERLDHHPDWSNTHSTVDVALSTHDAGGVTELDLQLARLMNRAAAQD